jgi:hypothetical protein
MFHLSLEPHQLTHSLSLLHTLSSSSLSLYTLTLSSKEEEEKERRGGLDAAAAGDGHGDHLEAPIHKR